MRETTEPATISIFELGIDVAHKRGFCIEATPCPLYSFSYFDCPIVLLDQTGIHEWQAGISILYTPSDRRYVYAKSADLVNTWFHFTGDEIDLCLEKYKIPTNKVLDLGTLPFLQDILGEVRLERSRQSLFWEDAVSDLMRRFLRDLGGVIAEAERSSAPSQSRSERILRDIRVRVHSKLAHRWTVQEMAALGNLHPAWFSTNYKKQFGLSPLEDLLNARVKRAEVLLGHFPMTVTQIASDCGFPNIEHFTRLFHKRVGCSPRQIQKLQKP